MTALTSEEIEYAYTYVDCAVRRLRRYSEDDIKDIKQRVMQILVTKWSRYDSARASRKTYLVCILHSATADAIKQHWRQWWRLGAIPLPDDYDGMDGAEESEAQMMERLLGHDRQMLDVARLKAQGRSQKQIAKELGIRRDAVREALDRVRRILKGESDESEQQGDW